MNVTDAHPGGLRERLARALRDALRARDVETALSIRTAMAAIDNAEAVAADSLPPVATAGSTHIAGAAAGVGASEVARRALSEEEVTAIVRAEIAELVEAADQCAKAGSAARSARLHTHAEVLRTVLSRPA